MTEKYKISYQNVGQNTYLAVEFEEGQQVVESMAGTITSNSISHFLSAFRLMLNGNTVIQYQISSKQSLQTMLKRGKLKKSQVITLLEGVIAASKEAAEYRLPAAGILLDPDYIFVDPHTFSPDFVYLPIMKEEKSGIKPLIMDLVMGGKIELTNDNFVQQLLETVNGESLVIEQLEQCLNGYREKKEAPAPKPVSNPAPVPIPQAVPIPSEPVRPKPVQEPALELPKEQAKPQSTAKLQKKKPEKKQEIDKEKAKKKFILPQAVIMVGLSACISFGLFVDAAGKIVLENVLAAVIIITVTEIILYREAYVNPGKEKKKSVPTKSAAPPIPNKEPVPESRPVPEPEPKWEAVSRSIPAAVPIPVVQPIPSAESRDWEETEATELFGTFPYLEYYEDGRMQTYNLLEDTTLAGHLSSQVNLVIHNPKVGRIHAEFVLKEGQVFVRDLNSLNGTYLNGGSQRINSNVLYPLKDNDKIRLANCELTLHAPMS